MATKVALITGGTSGIGLDLAKALTDRGGWKIHVLGRNEAHLAHVAQELPHATVHRADVSVYRELAAAFQTVFRATGRIDFVFANAGVIERTNFYADHTQPGDDRPPPPLDPTTLDVDLHGVISTAYLTLHYHRLSAHRGQPVKLIINSSCGGFYPAYYAPLYSAAKHGAIGFMRSIARHFQLEGIQVNAICPGIVRANLVDQESWKSFPGHRFAPVQTVSAVVLLLLDGGEEGGRDIVDSNEARIPSSRLYGCAVEISGSRFYFRAPPEYCDRGMEEVMGATALENQIGAILNA